MRIKRLILALLIMAWPLSAMAATLSCDPQPGVERYEFVGLGEITESPALPGGVMSVNLDALPAGNYTVKARACSGVWCSELGDPFAFTKPSFGVPASMRIGR